MTVRDFSRVLADSVEVNHSVHADRIVDYTGRRPVQPFDILKAASKACAELAEAIADEDVDAIIAAERRLVAVGGLAQTNANILELGRRP